MDIVKLISAVENTPVINRIDYLISSDQIKNNIIAKLNKYKKLLPTVAATPGDFCDALDAVYGEPKILTHEEKQAALVEMDLYLFARNMADRC